MHDLSLFVLCIYLFFASPHVGEVEYYWLNITQPGIEPVPPEVEVWGLNLWTIREGPYPCIF